jgi:hypothetical protein
VNDDSYLARDIKHLRRWILKSLPEKANRPSLTILVGLPGSGKSYFAARLLERVPAVIIESDFMRKKLVRRAVYSNRESARLFRALHELTRELLASKYHVIFDATNLNEDYRRPFYRIAEETGAQSIIVHLNTPREVAEERLGSRAVKNEGYSDADWNVYQALAENFEPIKQPHYQIRENVDISSVIDKIVAELNKGNEGVSWTSSSSPETSTS